MASREATCSCGQLRLTADGEPIRVTVCHCLACQRRTGSAFGAQARFPAERVQISGRSTQYTRISDDGESRTFSFCPECGATVFYGWGSEPDNIGVPLGAFADPVFPAPTRSIYESRMHPWATVPTATEHDPL
jgi:hypothetical protein